MQFLEVGHGFFRAAQIRLAHDFDERRTGPVEVNIAEIFALRMDVLARVVFHVDAGDADAALFPVDRDVEPAVLAEGKLELRNLVVLGHVGVEIVFPGELRALIDGRVDGERHARGVFHGLAVEHGQNAGHSGANFADIGVGLVAEGIGAGTEKLAGSGQVHVHFQADDSLVCGHGVLPDDSG